MPDHLPITYKDIQNGDFFYLLSCGRKVVFLQDNTDTHFADYVQSAEANRPRPTRMNDGCYHALELNQVVFRCTAKEARELVLESRKPAPTPMVKEEVYNLPHTD